MTRKRLKGYGWGALVAVALTAGCANDDWEDDSGPTQAPEWQRVGDEDTRNFAYADRFCQRLVSESDIRLSDQIYEADRGTGNRVRVSESDRRAYWDCMRSQGWQVEGTRPQDRPPEDFDPMAWDDEDAPESKPASDSDTGATAPEAPSSPEASPASEAPAESEAEAEPQADAAPGPTAGAVKVE